MKTYTHLTSLGFVHLLLVGCMSEEGKREERLLECLKEAANEKVAMICRYVYEEKYVEQAKLDALRKERKAYETMFTELEDRLPHDCPDTSDLACFGEVLSDLTIEHGLVEFAE